MHLFKALILRFKLFKARHHGGMEASEMKRMRELEEENAKLKRLFADVSLENQAMKDLFAKKGW